MMIVALGANLPGIARDEQQLSTNEQLALRRRDTGGIHLVSLASYV